MMIRKLLLAAIAASIPLSAAADSNVTTHASRLEKAVLFDYGQTRVRSPGRAKLAAVAREWRASSTPLKIMIEGHGYVAEEEASIELGYLRAARVRDYLITQGVNPTYIEAVGHSRAAAGRYVDLVFEPAPSPAMTAQHAAKSVD
jgi:outer membrane protein OmpA-like peptidoglycan-associated protein